jgi:virginiamycin A acetyltransferase
MIKPWLFKLISILKCWFLRKNNKVFSVNTSYKALKGEKSEIREGAVIDAATSIGSYCYIGRNTCITKTTIGNYCSIANNVSIGQGEHRLNNISTNSIFYKDAFKILTEKECTIGHDVWIGVDAIILRGVTIGNGVVIGANSVVTKDIEAFSIVVGSPAKVIKSRFNKEKSNRISSSQWWNLAPAEAEAVFNEMESKF